MYGYAQVNFTPHPQAHAQVQGRAAGYWPVPMNGRPGTMGLGVGVGAQGIMGPGQPVVVGGPGKGGAGAPGR